MLDFTNNKEKSITLEVDYTEFVKGGVKTEVKIPYKIWREYKKTGTLPESFAHELKTALSEKSEGEHVSESSISFTVPKKEQGGIIDSEYLPFLNW